MVKNLVRYTGLGLGLLLLAICSTSSNGLPGWRAALFREYVIENDGIVCFWDLYNTLDVRGFFQPIQPSPTPVPAPTSMFYSPISPLPTPTLEPPIATPVPTLEPPTPMPSPTPKPTYPPYTDAPLTLTFLRDGDLWLSEMGGQGERRLTDELAGWSVKEYAVSPACDRIAYVTHRTDPRDAAIEQVDLVDRTVSGLAGLDDRLAEYGLRWLDPERILFRVDGYPAAGEHGPLLYTLRNPFFAVIFDLSKGEYTPVDGYNLWQSEGGRYQVICAACAQGYAYECGCSYLLRDQETGQEGPIAQGTTWGIFLGWSAEDGWALFASGEYGLVLQKGLVAIDMATRSERIVTPEERVVMLPGWSPDRRRIALTMCERQPDPMSEEMQNCDLWVMDPDGSHARLVLDGGDDGDILFAAWSPDGRTLAFHQCGAIEGAYHVPLQYCGLGLIDPDGGDPVIILDVFPDNVAKITWHPDGSRLLITGSSHSSPPIPNIWSVRRDGTDLRPFIIDARDVDVLCDP